MKLNLDAHQMSSARRTLCFPLHKFLMSANPYDVQVEKLECIGLIRKYMDFMVSPAVQGQVPHPSIVPEFLRPTSCGMTSARG
ncbi:hypothetical protein TNCV_2186591 [Trichonephila clavipes]|nr:hypothetical protein TNCV_2186591 [Trichonephila clavipes]